MISPSYQYRGASITRESESSEGKLLESRYVRRRLIDSFKHDSLLELGSAGLVIVALGALEGGFIVRPEIGAFTRRYAMLNVLPSFMGQPIPAVTITGGMGLPAIVISQCPNQALKANGCRLLRGAVGVTAALSTLYRAFDVTKAAKSEYRAAVWEGVVAPTAANVQTKDGVAVRLCSGGGLANALGCSSVLPVLVSPAYVPLSPQIVAAVSKRIGTYNIYPAPPLYCRLSEEELLSGSQWTSRIGLTPKTPPQRLVLEVDTFSTSTPQCLLLPPRQQCSKAYTHVSGLSTVVSTALSTFSAVSVKLTCDREEHSASESSRNFQSNDDCVIVSARAALLSAVLVWLEELDAATQAKLETERAEIEKNLENLEEKQSTSTILATSSTRENDNLEANTKAEGASVSVETIDLTASPDLLESNDNDSVAHISSLSQEESQQGVWGYVERIGRGCRHVLKTASDVTVHSAKAVKNGVSGFTSALFSVSSPTDTSLSIPEAVHSKVVYFDTDNEESRRWLADKLLPHGWIVKKPLVQEELHTNLSATVVHYSSDQLTLAAAIDRRRQKTQANDTSNSSYVCAGVPGICAILHSEEAAAFARNVLSGPIEEQTSSRSYYPNPDPRVSHPAGPSLIICTAALGEELLSFVRKELLSGRKAPNEVQKRLDEEYGRFYDPPYQPVPEQE